MKHPCWVIILWAASSSVVMAQTAQSTPDESKGREFLLSRIDQGKSNHLSLARFDKVDGRTTTGADGVTRYTMFINAEVGVLDKVSVSTGIAALGNSYPVSELKVAGATRGDVFSQLDAGANMVSTVCAGQVLKLEGKLTWELFESGWRRSEVAVTVDIDSKGIDCSAASANDSSATSQSAGSAAAETPLARDFKSAVRSRTRCNDLGELRNLKRVEVGAYGANARPYYTYSFDLQMNCQPGAPFYGFRGRVDDTGRVRFVVQVSPEP